MITKEKLKVYANKLMFDMEDSEYETLLKEFDVILKQMDKIGEIEEIKALKIGLNFERVLILIRKKTQTKKKYPRLNSKIIKNPLK